jgi:hypothetical protein
MFTTNNCYYRMPFKNRNCEKKPSTWLDTWCSFAWCISSGTLAHSVGLSWLGMQNWLPTCAPTDSSYLCRICVFTPRTTMKNRMPPFEIYSHKWIHLSPVLPKSRSSQHIPAPPRCCACCKLPCDLDHLCNYFPSESLKLIGNLARAFSRTNEFQSYLCLFSAISL